MFGGEYYDGPRRYQTRVKNAQEAHEAIRPTDFRLTPSQLERVLDADDWKVYDLSGSAPPPLRWWTPVC
jgi:DNA topoisomerase-1